MDSSAQLALDNQLCFRLYAATRAVTKQYSVLLEGTGLTYPQYLVMLVLWEAAGPITVGALGGRLRLDSGTLTPVLKRLEGAGLVTRSRDAEDERRVLVALTPDGWAMRDRVAEVPARLQDAVAMPDEAALTLRAQLDELLEHLDRARQA